MPSPAPAAGLRITPEARKARKEWVDRNPLRAWRHSQDPRMSILETAELVGVGMSMIQMYEKGVHKPGKSKDEALTRLLGKDWSKRWDAWLESRPR